MTAADLLSLSPLIAIAATAVVAMVVTPFVRSQRAVAVVTVVGLIVALAMLGPAGAAGRAEVDPNNVQQTVPLLATDGFSLFFTGLVTAAAIVVALLAYGYLRSRPVMRCEFYVLLVTATLGGAVMASSVHFAAFFLGLELLSISLYALVGYQRANLRGLEAALKYLVLGGASSAVLVFGMALLYADTGQMQMAHCGTWIGGNPVGLIGVGLILVGVAFKLSLVPMHLWAADVYEGAPAPVSAFIATVSKGAVAAVFLRFLVAGNLMVCGPVPFILTALAVASMFVGNLMALRQENLKRLLAYSSIAHMGYLLVALLAAGMADETATKTGDLPVAAVTYYLVAYFATTLGAFGVITMLSSGRRTGEDEMLDDYRGLAWRRPVMAAVLAAMMFSLAGIPLTAGFVGKFYVLAAGVGTNLWALVIILAANSAIGLYYYLRVVRTLFRRPESGAAAADRMLSLPLAGGVALAVVVLAVVWLGVWPSSLAELIRTTIGTCLTTPMP
jgi:NADH-quinone oxidoreductase subunit N